MGIEKDFLMRQMMMLFEAIQKILWHRKRGEDEEAHDQIEYFYSCLKIDKEVSELSISELVEFLEKEKRLTNEQIEMVAFVLKEQGELAKKEEQQIDFFRKSFFLLEKVDHESLSFSMDRQMKLAELREYLN
ncbi:MAG: hypothetical protein HQ541_17345 [Mariniphaga sp.]|nr:hypothetical protein [Mariniphaga sp.]